MCFTPITINGALKTKYSAAHLGGKKPSAICMAYAFCDKASTSAAVNKNKYFFSFFPSYFY